MVREKAVDRLLDAVLAVAANLELEVVLRRIVESARTLIDAQYAALGVLSEDGTGLSEFVHVGMNEEAAEKIDHLPKGLGILGLLITDPRPVRLDDLSEHPRSSGFPDHHPEMRTFLGVPIQSGERVFGNLYLTEKRGGEPFTRQDEQLVIGLAAVAGTAIENARLFADVRRREQWLQATWDTTTALLSGAGTHEVLRQVAARARELVGADLAAVAVAVPDGDSLMLEVAEGANAEELRGLVFPLSGSLSGHVITHREALIVPDASVDERSDKSAVALAGIGPALFLPLLSHDQIFGSLVVANLRGGKDFSREDLRLVESFAAQASITLDYGSAREDLARFTLIEERERIGRDLHDTVIQRLFATGLSLQGTARRLSDDPEVVDRLHGAVDELDETIRDIRTTIFQLQSAPGRKSLRNLILGLVNEVEPTLGFSPRVRFDGPVDTVVPAQVVDEIIPTLREALSNVARHSAATSCDVLLAVARDVRLRVRDDGRGYDAEEIEPGFGLENMRRRARRLGGDVHISSAKGEGATIDWRVPLPIEA